VLHPWFSPRIVRRVSAATTNVVPAEWICTILDPRVLVERRSQSIVSGAGSDQSAAAGMGRAAANRPTLTMRELAAGSTVAVSASVSKASASVLPGEVNGADRQR
jgi:hypothetical protein